MLKYFPFLFLFTSLSVLAQTEPSQFVVHHELDTLEARQLHISHVGVHIETLDGEYMDFRLEDIAFIKKDHRRHGPLDIEVMETPYFFYEYTPMIVQEKGKLNLWSIISLESSYVYLVRGEGSEYYLGALDTNFRDLRNHLWSCEKMREYYSKPRDIKFRDMGEIIRRYNEVCD